MLWP
ncbi:hypothetical protein YPPY93_0750, partial [Yersinia pestis PY-93]